MMEAGNGRRRVALGLWARRFAVAGCAVVVGLLLAAISASMAQANSPIYSVETTPSTTQAGGHPDVEVGFAVGNRATQGFKDPCFCNDPKVVTAHLPTGLIGNPHVTPQCTTTEFAAFECPVDSQVGLVATLLFNSLGKGGQYWWEPLYNMEPHTDQAGLLAFPAPLIENPIYVELSSRTDSDYGLDATTSGIERTIPIFKINQFLWGIPADPIHNALRLPTGTGQNFISCGFEEILPELRENKYPAPCFQPPFTPAVSNSPRLPLLSNPTSCTGVLTSSLDTLSFDHGTDHAETTYPAITGCDQLQFNPSLSAKPTTTETDAPSGLDIDLKVPQLQSPTTPSPSEIKAATITLPEGFSINPNAADGKVSCSDLDGSFGTTLAAHCPEFSKVGTLEIDSSALPGPIPGYIYLGDPKPGDRYRLILAADGFATHIKLVGSAVADPQTGQIVASFQNLPQSPLTEFKLHLFGSERGLLATPTQCGTYAVHSKFTPWDGALAEQNATQFFSLDTGPTGVPCPGSPRPFDPSFAAASAGNTAGAHSSFSVTLSRDDGDQNLSGLTVTTPPGFAATLKGVPYCPETAITQLSALGYAGLAEQASSTCPAASQIGTTVAGAGAGTHPLYSPGKVYLAGPYKGAPLSLVVVIPAISGPYDLGAVAVRAAIKVDPTTAQVTTVSDPLPRILEGVPLRTRSITVNLDRPDFALNPTNCDPFAVNATIDGDEGARASLSSRYQVANCSILPYAPKLSLTMSGGVNRRGHPAIHALLQTGAADANTRSTAVTLPKGELLDNAHISSICTRVQFAAGSCPESSRIGEAEARSPLLDQPLTGSVYLRSSSNKLPDLVIDLKGQISFTAVARIDSVDGRLRTTFETVPDVPLGTFVLNLQGGAKGLVTNSEGLCGAKKRATVRMTGQNGDVMNSKPKLRVACGGKAGQKHRHQSRKAGH